MDIPERIRRLKNALVEAVTGWTYDLTTPATMVNRAMGRTLIRTFSGDGGQYTDLRKGFTGYGLLQYALVRTCRPRRVLCIGSRKGFVPAILSQAIRDNGMGHVDFVDPGYARETHPGKSWGGVGFWQTVNLKKHFGSLGVSSCITMYRMTSAEFASVHPTRKYQYIYIDGDHSYKGVSYDYRTFWPRLARGGFMVFHDISASGTLEGGVFGVRKLWNEIKSGAVVEFSEPHESGLGILRKR